MQRYTTKMNKLISSTLIKKTCSNERNAITNAITNAVSSLSSSYMCQMKSSFSTKSSNSSSDKQVQQPVPSTEKIKMSFIEAKSGDRIQVEGLVGKSVLEVALDNDIDIEGACGGELACSTCHVILEQSLYDHLPGKKEEETDMLDLAWGLTDTSRLCCQIKVTKDIEGATFTIPVETNSML